MRFDEMILIRPAPSVLITEEETETDQQKITSQSNQMLCNSIVTLPYSDARSKSRGYPGYRQ